MEDNGTEYCDNKRVILINTLKNIKYNYKILTNIKEYSILSLMKRFKKVWLWR